MLRFLSHWFSDRFIHRTSADRSSSADRSHSVSRRSSWRWPIYALIGLLSVAGISFGFAPRLSAQSDGSLQRQENQVIRELALPPAPAAPPVYQPEPAYSEPAYSEPAYSEPAYSEPAPQSGSAPAAAQNRPPARAGAAQSPRPARSPLLPYVLEFTRSPVVGNRLRLEGVYAESRLGFTRPQNWQIASAKAVVRFQHSPSLLPEQSHLTLRVNDTSIGSVKLDRPNSRVAEATFEIPKNLIQDYNEISMLAEQQTSENCTNAADPTLWTEILPDSKILFEYRPQPVQLNFSRYPFPFLDNLSLDANQLSYLQPKTVSSSWLTAIARFQASAARIVDFRPLDTRLVNNLAAVKPSEKLVIVGTPTEQPALSQLTLPYAVKNGQILDGNKAPLPDDVGVLMLTTVKNSGVPVLVATGNSNVAVLKAVQFLVQTKDREIGAGQALTVSTLSEVPSPNPRDWSGYLPTAKRFQLNDLLMRNRKPFEEVTVHGSKTLPIIIDFHALPDDRFLRGSTATLNYSYSPQVNPRSSAIEVTLDDVTIGAKRLTSTNGGRESFNVELPERLIKPDSRLGVHFVLQPQNAGSCGLVADRQLWGTLHSDSRFDMVRDNVVKLPDLKLLKTGFPVTAPQDLSNTIVVLPDDPKPADLKTLIAFSDRMGRLSRSEAIQLQVYAAKDLPADAKSQSHLVGIGTRDRFPFPEAFETAGLNLGDSFVRLLGGSQVQALPDPEGMVKEIVSPWNSDRLLLALTGQTDQGLQDLQDLFGQEPLFSRLEGDTLLISRNRANPVAYDSSAYNMEFLQAAPTRRLENTDWVTRLQLFLQDNWYLVPLGIVILALLLYSMSQLFINRVVSSGDS
ncbi:MAG: cellulose biosynthesis cyclic di-GMP-binding regulatory protein BcsB [Oscillatoriophycideae cyanobacterium NC_groundwater_1537_Pr4_S-0.65um_50_18]|nr:cellulose biosynthesis cyclic di-GMP-binding regulatory protein BcsB [Oscillatoriophycideae cyanobacterium NC_groundwater_1537_Pr4_S-0.65um_50_18]